MWIVFEGGDGSGKSTQAVLLADKLTNKGYEVVLTREPGGGPLGSQVREWMLHSDNLSPLSQLFLISASRVEHLNHVIYPALAAGKIVICDRFLDSTIAYQGYGNNLSLEIIKKSQDLIQSKLPDRTYLLDMEPSLSLKRATVRGNATVWEQKELAFHERVREGFLSCVGNDHKVLDANLEIQELHEIILKDVLNVHGKS